MIGHKLNFMTVDFDAHMQYFMIRVANFIPLYLKQFWVKIQSFCAHQTGIFQNSPYFYLQLIFKGLQEHLNVNHPFFGTSCMQNVQECSRMYAELARFKRRYEVKKKIWTPLQIVPFYIQGGLRKKNSINQWLNSDLQGVQAIVDSGKVLL